ncbi:MAG TPA: hypothetical protein VGS22_24870 [Thermoanaerobaculia bacterium]|jgi:ankyrin repeat protein|nr:hypothetical protein [Thermoanaerobaculia bacterium]
MSKTKLFALARAWDSAAVRQLLVESPDLVGARDAKGRTALHYCAGAPASSEGASARASVATARELLKAGADLNAVHEIPDHGEIFPATPLWYALARGRNGSLAEFLLQQGADPDHCLWTVIWFDEAEWVRKLLAAGSKTEIRAEGATPLIYAARLGREKAILHLVAAGANTGARDAQGRTAADLARKKRLSPAILAALDGEP